MQEASCGIFSLRKKIKKKNYYPRTLSHDVKLKSAERFFTILD